MDQLRLPALLVIMDGFGIDKPGPGNAISLANKPCLDHLTQTFSHTLLEASGEAVGLPEGQMGNSEVGHLNIGAGRVVFQELTRINKACREGSICHNEVINSMIDEVKAAGGAIHLMGLLSDGGVHSSIEHLEALLKHVASTGVSRVYVHGFMDGRDVPPSSGNTYVDRIQELIDALNAKGTAVSLASLSGRYYAMDRDNRWDRVEKAFDTLTQGANHADMTGHEAMEASYAQGTTDEFVVPVNLDAQGVMKPEDGVIFFNFRPDRAREITRALVDVDFAGFERKANPHPHFVCLTEYDPSIDAPVAFKKEFPDNVLADVLASAGLKQYHIAETEKYAHVTFFFNGGIEAEKHDETRKLISSPKVATYDLQPEMSEPEVADTLAQAILNDEADVYIVNFANPDMVGHTGIVEAAKAAVEAVDQGVGKVVDAIKQKGGFALITADHGNADKMIAADGTPHTAHTTAPVPLILADYTGQDLQLSGAHGALCDIAPTLLACMGIEQPVEFTGTSLLRENV